MTANPSLVRLPNGELLPAPFPNESVVLKRAGMTLELDGVHTRSGKWSSKGDLFLSDVRLVFVAEKPDSSGLVGFDLPLVYIEKDKLNQPIFGCNNLAGKVWPAVAGGGPRGTLPPHDFKLSFKEGGIGTFYPLYYALLDRARRMQAAATQAPVMEPEYTQQLVHQAFVDPNDPSTVYLTQPVDNSQRLNQQPVYAPNYGVDERYEPMGLRP